MMVRNKQNEILCVISDESYSVESNSVGFLRGFSQTLDKKFFKRVKKRLSGNDLLKGNMKEYIRFGEIPEDERSKIGNGCVGDGYEVEGYEKGVSVWDCVYNFDTNMYQLIAPHPTRFTYGDFSQSAFPDNCCGCDSDKKIYVVTGIEVGYGADNEPLIKNVKIVKELPFNYFKQKIVSNRKIKE